MFFAILILICKKSNCIKYGELIDDGFSGITFDRPGFNGLIKLINKGKIDCIIVKDDSRLGRDFVETEKYIERIFPLWNVRYISINQNSDSLKKKTFNQRISAPIERLSNEYHVAGTSQKTRASLETKYKHGENAKNFAVYGYLKDGKSLIIDKEAAQIVRLIFKLKINGYSHSDIAKTLNNQKILCPLEYKKSKGIPVSDRFKQKEKALWSAVPVKRILENPVYSGVLILGKTTTPSYKDKKNRYVKPKSEQFIFNDLHEPIISKEDFEIVKKLLETDLWSVSGQASYPLSGVCFCDCCGNKLYRDKKPKRNAVYYNCRSPECQNRAYIREETLSEMALKSAKNHIDCVIQTENILSELRKEHFTADKILSANERTENAEEEIKRLENRRVKAFSAKHLPENEREKLIKSYDLQIAEKEEYIENLQTETEKLLDSKYQNSKWAEMLKDFADFSELTRAMAVSLIEKITVAKGKIGITFRYADEYENARFVAEKGRECLKNQIDIAAENLFNDTTENQIKNTTENSPAVHNVITKVGA